MGKRSYQHALPGVALDELGGTLIVIEGPDGSGRSSQIWLLSRWLEERGFAVEQMGLKRSKLVANELEQAKQGNVLSPRTMALFYATDFYDQLENRIVPALGSTTPPRTFMSVDLPAPFSPIRPITSPRPTERLTRSSATTPG